MPEKFIADGLFLMEFLRTFGHIVDKSGAFADMASMGKQPANDFGIFELTSVRVL